MVVKSLSDFGAPKPENTTQTLFANRSMRRRKMTSPGVDLSGKTACITGGGQGLGASMAIGLAEAGADVVLIGRRPEPMVETAKECEKFGVQAMPARLRRHEFGAGERLIRASQQGIGRPAYSHQQRGRVAPKPHSRDDGRNLGRHHRFEFKRHVLLLPRGGALHARGGRRQNHQSRLGRRQPGPSQSGGLCGV